MPEKAQLIEELTTLADENPSAALARASELGESPAEAFAAAAILIDCGGHLEDLAAVNEGVMTLQGLRKNAKPDPGLAYNLANGLQSRARITYGPSSPFCGQSFEDHFQARILFGQAAQSQDTPIDLASQALTNMGTLLQDTSRWIEALDYFRAAQRIYSRNAVAMLKEMTLLQQLAQLFQSEPDRYECYGHLPTLTERYRVLGEDTAKNSDTLIAFSGNAAIPYMHKQIAIAGSIPPNPQASIDEPYFRFISEQNLSLYLHCSSAGYASGLFDVLTIPAGNHQNH